MRFTKPKPAPEPTHWDVLHWLLKIDPPPSMGDSWLDGVCDGVYQVQCALMGKAQGQAGQGDFASAVETAKTAADLNWMRQFAESGDGA